MSPDPACRADIGVRVAGAALDTFTFHSSLFSLHNSLIVPQAADIPRYTDIPLPDGCYRPGCGMTHPSKQPGGPHIPSVPDAPAVFGVDTWHRSPRYLYGVDLFNHRFWWEAHEVWEALWNETGRRSPVGRFIQGLIQIAAALLKDGQSNRHGAERLAAAGLSKLRSRSGVFLGVDVDAFGRQVEAYIRGESVVLPEIKLSNL